MFFHVFLLILIDYLLCHIQISRSQVFNRLWAYIQRNKLSNTADRHINCDDALKRVFNVNQINMLTMGVSLPFVSLLGSPFVPQLFSVNLFSLSSVILTL
jgi:chromatin remodeling complex protein RSC6